MAIDVLIMVAVLGWLLTVRFYKIIRLLRSDIIKLAILRGIYSENVDPEEWEKVSAELKGEIQEINRR